MRAALLAAALLLGAAAVHARQDESIAAAMNDLQVQALRDLSYGPHPRQKLDVYLPGTVRGPLVLVVHGGAWAFGDKRSAALIVPKVRRWTAQGYVVASTNYRFVPEASPLEQARDVARALALLQKEAPRWGADPRRVVLVGHSAGAHLVALLAADPALARAEGAQAWRGAVSLDSAALDVPGVMQRPHAALYDRAFGADPVAWEAASPWHRLTREAPPLLAVCSTRRGTSCAQSEAFRRKAAALGVAVTVQGVDKRHAEINEELGPPGPYTDSVDRWISSIL